MQAQNWPLCQCSMWHILKRKLHFIEAADHFSSVLYTSYHLTTQILGQANIKSCVHPESNVIFVIWRHKLIRNFVLVIEFRHAQDRANYLRYGVVHNKVVHKEQLRFSAMVFLKHHNLKCDNKNVHGTVSFNIKLPYFPYYSQN